MLEPIQQRRSIRSYSDTPVPANLIDELLSFASDFSAGPFGNQVHFHVVDVHGFDTKSIKNLGTYASTKYALNAISLTARKELEPDKIIVSVFHPRMTATNFGKNAVGIRMFEARASSAPRHDMPIDSAEAVAAKILQQIESEEAEAMMG